MDTWIWALIGAFVVVDSLVTFVVLRRIARRKREPAAESQEEAARRKPAAESQEEAARRMGLG